MKTISFMRNLTGKSLLVAGMGLVLSGTAAFAADPGMKTLPGHVPAIVSRLQAKGLLSATTNLNLAIGLPLRNAEALTNLLRQIYDPASTNYHHYLTPDEFTAQFGPTEQDYQKVVDFANANGLAVTKTHGNRVLLDVSGKTSDIEKAFHVTLRTYHHPTENRDFFAPDVEPSVDVNLPAIHKRPVSNAKPAVGSAPGGGYIGSDFRNAYVPGSSLNGSGQTVGLLQFDSGFFQSDITAYETQAGLPNVSVQPVLLDGYGGGPGEANDEVSLDIEMVISMAPGISKVLVFEGSLTDDILNSMAASNQVKQLSASWTYPIDALTEQIYQQFAAQGQSFFNAAGDDDAWLTGQIPQPADDPHITIVGGTTLSTSVTNGSWALETVWNWGIEFGIDGIGTGGGISTTYAIPFWQTNINMTASGGSATFRRPMEIYRSVFSIRRSTPSPKPRFTRIAFTTSRRATILGAKAPPDFLPCRVTTFAPAWGRLRGQV
jgi:subtilase family serine protease